MSAYDFLDSCVGLFGSAVSAVLGEPVLATVAGAAVFLAVLATVGKLVRGWGRM